MVNKTTSLLAVLKGGRQDPSTTPHHGEVTQILDDVSDVFGKLRAEQRSLARKLTKDWVRVLLFSANEIFTFRKGTTSQRLSDVESHFDGKFNVLKDKLAVSSEIRGSSC